MKVETLIEDFTHVVGKRHPTLRVEVLGSARHGDWRLGRSDLDIVVYAQDKISSQVRREVYDILYTLSMKHGLDLGQIPCPHPPIVFVDSEWKRILAQKLLEKDRLKHLRRVWNRACPRTDKLVKAFRMGLI